MSALALMAASENRWIKIGPGDVVILSSHPIPGNEAQRHAGDRRAAPAGRRGRALGHRRRARVGSRQAGGAEDAAVDRHADVVRPGPRRVPPPDPARPAGPASMGVPGRPGAGVRGRRPARARPTTVSPVASEPCPPGYLYVDGIVGDVGRGRAPRPPGAGRGGRRRRDRGRRRHAPGRSSPVPRSSPAAGCTPPRPRTCSTSAPTRSARPSPRRSQQRGRRHRDRCSATCAGPPVGSSTSGPAGGR